jgi:hypothetical protein
MPRTGNGMRAALRFIAAHPRTPKLAVAEAVGPNGSRRYGYQIVDRCIAAGLVHAGTGLRGCRLTLTDAGRATLR